MYVLSQCLNEHVSSFSRAFQNCPSPTQRLAGWLLLYVTHVLMLVHMSTINKQMRARPGGREAQLAHLWQDKGTRGRIWGGEMGGDSMSVILSQPCLCQKQRVRTRVHTLSSLTSNPQRLISVSDKVEQQVHSALHNKSISRVIEFHQSPLPLLRLAGSVPWVPQRLLPWDCTTVIIQLHSFLPS